MTNRNKQIKKIDFVSTTTTLPRFCRKLIKSKMVYRIQEPRSMSPTVKDQQKYLLQQLNDTTHGTATSAHMYEGVLTNQESNNRSTGSKRGHSVRRFYSSTSRTSSAECRHKITMDIPLHFVHSEVPTISLRPISRLSVHTSFPLFSPQRQQQQQRLKHLNGSGKRRHFDSATASTKLWSPDVTCHLSASTAIQRNIGHTSGSINIQYRWDHVHHTNRNHTNTSPFVPPPRIQRWSTTVNTRFGISESEKQKMQRNAMIESTSNASNGTSSHIIPIPSLGFGISTNMSHHQSSTSTLSVNLQSGKSLVQLPITLSNQQRIQLPFANATKSMAFHLRSQCTTVFDYNSSSLNLSTLHTSLSFSPSSPSSSKATTAAPISQPQECKEVTTAQNWSLQPSSTAHMSHNTVQSWTMNFGLMKTKDYVGPSIGVSFVLALPKLLQKIWTSSSSMSKVNNKSLDLSLQWKGKQGWQFGGWWIHKRKPDTSKGVHAESTMRQIGIGVSVNNRPMKGKTSADNSTMIPSPFGVLSWIFTCTEGDFTLRIPILISSTESAKSILYHQGFQIFYLSFVSTIVHDVLSHLFLPNTMNSNVSEQKKRENMTERTKKLRQEAIMQQTFMERQARTRTAQESLKNGLVIQRAIMYKHYPVKDSPIETSYIAISKMEESDKFDVTTPLQFWLSPHESKLVIYGKRSCMLGFYDLTNQVRTTPSDATSSESTQDLIPATIAVNCCWIQYDYDGISYEVTVNDDEEIELPAIQRSKSIESLVEI
jgi:Domain of unknown function (DUF3395)